MKPPTPTPTVASRLVFNPHLSVALLLLVGCLLAGCAPGEVERVSIDDQLHQTGLRHHTFGPTGRRLFTERYDPGLGIRGQYGYIHYAEIDNPLLLAFDDFGESLEPVLEKKRLVPQWADRSRIRRED